MTFGHVIPCLLISLKYILPFYCGARGRSSDVFYESPSIMNGITGIGHPFILSTKSFVKQINRSRSDGTTLRMPTLHIFLTRVNSSGVRNSNTSKKIEVKTFIIELITKDSGYLPPTKRMPQYIKP